MRRFVALTGALSLVLASAGAAQETPSVEQIAAALKQISPHVAAEAEREQLRTMLGRSLREQISAANRASSEAWANIETREDWERFRKEKLAALRRSLGELPQRPAKPRSLITGRIQGDGFQIHNLVYESRPGLVVTANLYLPEPLRDSMPGMLLSHSHHNPKDQGELQDMGMTWARAGCYVLVPDHLGHGERRQHPFATAADYDGQFQLGRQDYYFRYDTSLQLYLVGESLMGWMVHDLMTGVDLLLAQPGIDRQRIILLGSVAAGGDSAAVAAALDERIACVVPFNFGGPQPETRYPLPADAETSFNYAGSGSWESTRNLYRSAADGFLPWVIVGSVAPRRLIHAHEFAWDRERDPVWKRYQKIWGFCDASDHLAFTHGQGTLTGTDPPGSHCNNIGPVQRRQIHEAFRRWFNIDVKPEDEYTARRPREELTCLTDEARRQFQPKALHELLAARAVQQAEQSNRLLLRGTPPDRRTLMQQTWTRLLGHVEPPGRVAVRVGSPPLERAHGLTVQRQLLDLEPGISVPLLVVTNDAFATQGRRPLVLGIGTGGIASILAERRDELADVLSAGFVVALTDVRGTGATSPSTDRGQQGAATAHSATLLMLGQTMLASQLRDLRAVWRHLAARDDVDSNSSAVFGHSSIEPLAADTAFAHPWRIDSRPPECQPTGALLALLVALFEDDCALISSRGGLVRFGSILDSPYVQVPHECIIPGAVRDGGLPNLVAALAPRKAALEGLVDGRGRSVPLAAAREAYRAALRAYSDADATTKLRFVDPHHDPPSLRWPDDKANPP